MSDRIEELLAKAAEIDNRIDLDINHTCDPYRDEAALRREHQAARMEAAGYRAEALVVTLRGPRRCPVSHEGKRRCELDEGHEGQHRSHFPSGNGLAWS